MMDTGYDPRHDRGFVELVLNDLVDHRGEWRRLGRLYAADCPSFDRCCVVRDAVKLGRRVGMEIEGDRQRGYRYLRWRRPERRLQIHELEREIDDVERRAQKTGR